MYSEVVATPFQNNASFRRFAIINSEINLRWITTSVLMSMKSLKDYLQIKRNFPFENI